MILYQMAKWMDEWRILRKSIAESKGDVSFLLHKKAQVEQQMIHLTMKTLDTNVKPIPENLAL